VLLSLCLLEDPEDEKVESLYLLADERDPFLLIGEGLAALDEVVVVAVTVVAISGGGGEGPYEVFESTEPERLVVVLLRLLLLLLDLCDLEDRVSSSTSPPPRGGERDLL